MKANSMTKSLLASMSSATLVEEGVGELRR